MSDLLACSRADDQSVIDAVAQRLYASEGVPYGAASQRRARDKQQKRAERIVPHVLEFLREAPTAGNWLSSTGRRELAWGAKRAAQRGVGLIQSWLLAAVIELIVRWLIEWYFSPASRAWRKR